MPERIRTFIAIELDSPTQDALAQLQTRLKQQPGADEIRWVAAKNIHITLKFLGDVAAGSLPALQLAITNSCVGVAPFVLQFSGLGAFPSISRPNNIWVGAQGDVAQAALLAGKIEDACAVLGFPRERHGFEPHLTLGRVKRVAGSRERAEIAQMIGSMNAFEVGRYRVQSVSIMKSELRPSGSVYSRLAAVELK